MSSSWKHLGMVADTFNPCSREMEAGGPLVVQSQPDLHSEFQASLGLHGKTLSQAKQNNRKDQSS